MPLLILSALGLLLVLWFIGQPYLIERRRERLRRAPFPAGWRSILRRRVPYFRRLPADLQLQLKQHMQVFLAEKAFIGCAGLTVTEEMRVTVAAQACLLILNRPTDYFPSLRQILMYPDAFVVKGRRVDQSGVLHDGGEVLAGESWSEGQVILSWADTVEDAWAMNDGRNVVFHEFAHQLDQEKGHASGVPFLSGRARYQRWSRVFTEAYEQLRRQAEQGLPSLLDPYGASDPAEFFAVATEAFFEQSHDLSAEHPALYAELSAFYRVDPLSW